MFPLKLWAAYKIYESKTKTDSLPYELKELVETLNKDLANLAELGQTCIIGFLLKYKKIDPTQEDLNYALQSAATVGYIETVKLLLDRSANIHACGDGALHLAATNGHTETVELLLDRGANIHACNDGVLHLAAEHGHTETVRLLLDRGAAIHACDDYALCWAAANGHTETVRLLLDRGSNINVLSEERQKWVRENVQ